MKPNPVRLIIQGRELTDDLTLRSTSGDPARLRLLTVGQVAEVLGVSRSSVYRLLESQSLPSIRLGGVRRIRLSDLERLIAL